MVLSGLPDSRALLLGSGLNFLGCRLYCCRLCGSVPICLRVSYGDLELKLKRPKPQTVSLVV